ncbi:MAG: hypothetical protein AB1782_06290 [Cyanobacteriota bacterium]
MDNKLVEGLLGFTCLGSCCLILFLIIIIIVAILIFNLSRKKKVFKKSSGVSAMEHYDDNRGYQDTRPDSEEDYKKKLDGDPGDHDKDGDSDTDSDIGSDSGSDDSGGCSD